MNELDMKTLTCESVAKDWDNNPNEWYHALIAIEDLPIVLAIPDLKVYACCQCKLVANDGSEAHYHWHELVHFPSRKLGSWKRQAQRVNIKFSSPKNTFKKSSVMIMSLVCVTWHAKTVNELVVEMEMVS